MDVDSIALGRDFRGALQKTLESCDLMLVLIGRDWADVKDEEGRPRLHNPGDFVRLEIEAALKRDIVVTPILVQGAHMPAPEQLPADIRDLVYRNGFELTHNRWESDFAEMTRRLNLDIDKEGGRVEQPASTTAAPNASIAPAARPAIPGRQFLGRPLRVTRRQALGVAALAAAGTGAILAAPSIRRLLSKPPLRTIAFDVATVDPKGVRNPPEKYQAAVFTEVLGPAAGLDMVSIPGAVLQWARRLMSRSDRAMKVRSTMSHSRRFLSAHRPSLRPSGLQQYWRTPTKSAETSIRTRRFSRASISPSRASLGTRRQNFAGASLRSPAGPIGCRAKPNGKACRAGTMGPFHFGPTITPELANYCGTGGAVCGESDGRSVASDVYKDEKYESGAYGEGPTGVFRGKTTPVGTFPPNRFGLYDMHGNVWEYCLDMSSANYADVPVDGSANLSGPADSQRILRGGSWSHNPAICRSAYRDSNPPDFSGWQGRIGFRVVCTV
jgi:hypothetical protein